jgi:hypothetical protein
LEEQIKISEQIGNQNRKAEALQLVNGVEIPWRN